MTPRATLLYDRECGVCKWIVARVLERDEHLHLAAVAIQSPDGQRLLDPVPPARRLESWHLVLGDGHVHSAGEVFAPLQRALHHPARAWALERVPGLTGFGYKVVARRRALLGRFVSAGARHRAEEILAARAPAAGIAPPAPMPRPAPSPPPVAARTRASERPSPPAAAASASAPAVTAPAAPQVPETTPHPPATHREPRPAPQPSAGERPRAAPSPPAQPVPAPAPAPSSDQATSGDRVSSPDADGEALGWQQRFEESAYGRGVLSTLIVVTLIAIIAINLPGSDLRRQLLRPGQPYLNALGLDQNWSLFAPNPRRVVLDVSATVIYDDGRSARWTFPHDGALLGTYRDYRWRKWQENLITPLNAGLWRPAALWAASHTPRIGHAVRSVTLVERYANLEPPGTTPSTGPTAIRTFYHLQLRGPGGAA